MTFAEWMKLHLERVRIKLLVLSIRRLNLSPGVIDATEPELAGRLPPLFSTLGLGDKWKRGRWFKRIITFLQWLFFRCLERPITVLHLLFVWNGQGPTSSEPKWGMLIFCENFDKCVENVRSKKPINPPFVYVTKAQMETEMHGESEFWKFPAIGEQIIKEAKARGLTLIGALLTSDQVWLRVINDDFEFDVARQICELAVPVGRGRKRREQAALTIFDRKPN